MDWDKLRIFHAVAEAGSFTHAGESLNLSQSAVSRQISALEESLDVLLFHRHARGLMLTEQGEALVRTARDIAKKLNMAEARIIESRERPAGPLRITTTIAFGSVWLAPRLKEFLEDYPDIEASIVLSDNELDLSMREADVAIRLTPPTQADLVQRRLMTLRYHVFAAPSYLQAHGMPMTPADLDHHRLIIFGEDARMPVPSLNWLLDAGVQGDHKRKPFLQVHNSTYGIFPRGAERDRDRCATSLSQPRNGKSGGDSAGNPRPRRRCLFRLSRRTASLQPHRGLPRLLDPKNRRAQCLTHEHETLNPTRGLRLIWIYRCNSQCHCRDATAESSCRSVNVVPVRHYRQAWAIPD